MSTLNLAQLREALQKLDEAKDEFKEHPMYNEWLDHDELSPMECVCHCEYCDDCNPKEDDLDLEAFEESHEWLLDNL